MPSTAPLQSFRSPPLDAGPLLGGIPLPPGSRSTHRAALIGKEFVWLGDNLGMSAESPATIELRNQLTGRSHYMSVAAALELFDKIDARGRSRILQVLQHEAGLTLYHTMHAIDLQAYVIWKGSHADA